MENIARIMIIGGLIMILIGGCAFLAAAVAWSLGAYGWRTTAFASGVIVLATGLPLSYVIKRRPEDHGLVVDGAAAPAAAIAAEAQTAGTDRERDYTAREAVRTPAFWLLSLGHGFALFVVSAVNVHAVTHMKEGLGYSIETAALFIMLQTVCQIGGIAIGWAIGDLYDKRLISAACMLLHMAGLLCLTYASGTGMVIAFAVLHGTAWGLRGPFMPRQRRGTTSPASSRPLCVVDVVLAPPAMSTRAWRSYRTSRICR